MSDLKLLDLHGKWYVIDLAEKVVGGPHDSKDEALADLKERKANKSDLAKEQIKMEKKYNTA